MSVPRSAAELVVLPIATTFALRHPDVTIEVIVEDAEVTLNGKVRHKADRRRIEDVVDIDGVRHVQNNLRVHEHGHWTFL